MRTVWLIDMLSRMISSSRRAGRSSSRWKRIEVWRMRSTRSNTSAPSWSRTVSPRMRPSSRMSFRSRASSSSACASSARLDLSSVSEGMIWGDMARCSRKCPAAIESQFFGFRARVRKGRSSSSPERTYFVVPANAGTHNHRVLLLDRLGPQLRSIRTFVVGSRLRAATTTFFVPGRSLNPPPRPFPIGIAEAPLENLAGVLARQIFLDFDVFWHLVIGQRRLELRSNISRIQRYACLWFDHRHQRLAEFLVGDAEHRAVMHAGNRMQRGFDFGRIDVDPARDHHVALAVADEDVAVLVDVADIARGDKTVALDLGAFFRLVVVGEVRVAGDLRINLADLGLAERGPLVAEKAQLDAFKDLADRAGFPQRILGTGKREGAGFGAAVIFIDHRPPPFDHRPLHIGGTGRGGMDDVAQRGRVIFPSHRLRQLHEPDEHRRHHEERVDPLLFDQPQKLFRIEPRHQHQRTAEPAGAQAERVRCRMIQRPR